jgi:hypothetical protein
MITRRQFLKVLITTCATAAVGTTSRAGERSAYEVYLPLIQVPAAAPPEPTEPPLPPTPVPPPDDNLPPILDDAPIVGRATGTAEMAIAWLTPRADPGYTPFDIDVIVQRIPLHRRRSRHRLVSGAGTDGARNGSPDQFLESAPAAQPGGHRRHRRVAQRSTARSERMGVQYAAATLGTRHQFPDMG